MTDGTRPQRPIAAGGRKVDAPDEGRRQGRIDAKAQDRIGVMLRQHFDDLVAAPIPDQFLMLLAELEASEQALQHAQGQSVDKEKKP